MLKKPNRKNILFIIIPVIILIIVIIGVTILINLNNTSNKNSNPDGIKFKEEYELLNNIKDSEDKTYPEVSISSNNIIKYSTETEVINIIKNGYDGVVYFGYAECLYCRSSIEVLLNTAKDSKLDNILYIDTSKVEISDELLNLLGEDLTTEDGVYTSLVIFITDGVVVSYNKDTLSSHEDPYKKLYPSQQEGLSEIYKYGINDVVASKEIKK